MNVPTQVPPDPAFGVEVTPDGDWACLAPAGELDLATVPQFLREVDALTQAGFAQFRIDLRGLSFIDSTGMRCLLRLAQRGDLELRIIPGTGAVQRAFALAGVDGLLPTARSREMT